MKRKQAVMSAIALILAAFMLFAFAACDTVVVTSVELDRASLTLDIGQSATLSTIVLPAKAADYAANWRSSDTNVATVDGGKVTAVGEGTATIKVTVGGKDATCSVTVNDPSKREVDVTGITLNPTMLNLSPDNRTATITATVVPENATDKTLTWTSSNEDVATVDNGVVTAVGEGTAIITAISVNNVRSTCAVRVAGDFSEDDDTYEVDYEAGYNVGHAAGYNAGYAAGYDAGYDDGYNGVFGDSYDDACNSNYGAGSEGYNDGYNYGFDEGYVEGYGEGYDEGYDAGHNANQNGDDDNDPIPVTSIEVTPKELTLIVGLTGQVSATVLPLNATDKSFTWTSSDERIATVDKNGIVTAQAEGAVTITATTTDGNLTATCAVTVVEPSVDDVAVTGVYLNKSTLTVVLGQSDDTLVATVQPTDATYQGVTWSSDNMNVATVDNTGKITAVSVGTAIITVTTADGGFTDQCEVTVVFADASEITLNKTELSFNKIGATSTLRATVKPNTANPAVTWRSSDESVATVAGGVVTTAGYGTATITVTSADGKVTAQCEVTVTMVAVTQVTLNKKTLSFNNIGETATLTATVRPSSANAEVIWTTTDGSVATVVDGLVTIVGYGTATITATSVSDSTKFASCEITVKSDSIYVSEVASLSTRTQEFIMGMDSSAVLSLEAAGVTYKNFLGETQDVFQILKDNGITDIRIRVWNDPYDSQGRSYGGGNCDIDNAVKISKRCAAVGLGVIIDFHYSDFWADPGKQTLPKAWAKYTTDQVARAIYEFTKESLEKVKATGVKITMVQVGNETTSGMAGSEDWTVICNYMNQGSKAIREVTGTVANGGAKVAVHFTNPESGTYLSRAQTLYNNNVDYDVFGTSYYPYWHGTLENLKNQLTAVHNSYGKEVMVLETSYAFSYEEFDGTGNTSLDETPYPVTVQGQANSILSVIETIANLGDWGLGVCYWEGTWIAASTEKSSAKNAYGLCLEYGCGWASMYAHDYDSSAPTSGGGGCVIDNQAFFMSDGTPLESLKVFALAKIGNSIKLQADAYEEQEQYYTVDVGSIELPTSVTVTLNDRSVIETEVTWFYTPEQLEEYIHSVDKYVIEGTTIYGGTCYVTIFVMNENLLSGGSFEEDQDVTGHGSTDNFIQSSGLGEWEIEYNRGSSALQLYVSNDSGNASMGSQSFHFWDEATVSFTLKQTVDVSKLQSYGNGTYSCSFDIMGGDGTNMNIYSYITVNYSDGTSKTIPGNSVQLTEWKDWQRTSASVDIDDISKVKSVEVGIVVYAEVAESTNGPWGNIDNAQFYFDETKK